MVSVQRHRLRHQERRVVGHDNVTMTGIPQGQRCKSGKACFTHLEKYKLARLKGKDYEISKRINPQHLKASLTKLKRI